ncbi:MAG TPA: hypothetical protein VM308_02765 [Sphingomicrobium sp.]|nr:hypothetical protein [Sphingomicrobium sp.]
MAKKATGTTSGKTRGGRSSGGSASRSRAVTRTTGARSSGGGSRASEGMGEAFIKLLQSPLVAELVAVAATAALAALAEHGFTTGSDSSRRKRAGKAVKEAGKAAAAAVGRRLGTEIDEIRKSAKAKDAARA